MSSINFNEIEVQKLSRIHNTSLFDCGDEDINDFLRHDALLWQDKKLAATLIFIHKEKIIGFSCISADSIKLKESEKKKEEELNEKRISEVPAIKIGRLGRDKICKGQKVGEFILEWTIGLILRLSENVGVRFVTVDSYPNKIEWYKKLGFIQNLHKDYAPKDNVSMRYSLYNPSNNHK